MHSTPHTSSTPDTEALAPALLHVLEAMASSDRLTLYFDEQGVCQYVSSAILTHFGLTRHEVLGEGFDELHRSSRSPLPCTEHVPEFAELLTAPPSSHMKYPGVSFTPLRAPLGGLIVHHELSKASLHTLNNTPRWEVILNHFPIGTLLASYDGSVHFANDEARQILRREGMWTKLRKNPPYTLQTPRGEHLVDEDHPMQRAITSGKNLINETLLLCFHDDQEVKRLECSVFHVNLSDAEDAEKVLLCLFRDVSARYQRSVEKGDLLSIASHELRNPLTPLKGLLHMLKQDYQQHGNVQVELIHKAQNQVERLVKLVDGLLDLSIVETGKFSYSKKNHDLRELVDELVAGWCIRHGDERFELEMPMEPLPINIDAAGIEQVLHNLLDNAIKHSPEERPIFIQLTTTQEEAILRVEDRGKGFVMEHSSQLFDRFTQGNNMTPRHGSLGLGLYVCKCIIEEHDGSIRIDSVVNQGTTVVVSLPLR
jgi:signal transduction histidine kinase